MPELTPNSRTILETVARLHMADREMLTALCTLQPNEARKQGFGLEAVKKAIQNLKASGHLKWLYFAHDPKLRNGLGSKREIYFLGPDSFRLFAWSDAQREKYRRHFLRLSTAEWRLKHDLMVSKLHAFFLLLERDYPHAFRLTFWDQGEGTGISQPYTTNHGEQRRVRIIPDARFQVSSPKLEKSWWYFLEADRGTERNESDDRSRRTIAQKANRYRVIRHYNLIGDQFPEMRGFHVLFLAPRRSPGFERLPSLREGNLMATARRYGGEAARETTMFRFMSESDIRWNDPGWLLGQVLYTSKVEGLQLPIVPTAEASQEPAQVAS